MRLGCNVSRQGSSREGVWKDAFYYHRFVIWDEDWNLVKVSKQFQYMGTRIEFTCGLAVDGDDLLISFGYQDNAAYILRWPKHLMDKLEWEDLDKIRISSRWGLPTSWS